MNFTVNMFTRSPPRCASKTLHFVTNLTYSLETLLLLSWFKFWTGWSISESKSSYFYFTTRISHADRAPAHKTWTQIHATKPTASKSWANARQSRLSLLTDQTIGFYFARGIDAKSKEWLYYISGTIETWRHHGIAWLMLHFVWWRWCWWPALMFQS